MKNLKTKIFICATAIAMTGFASAAAVDVSGAVASINENIPSVSAVGVAAFGLAVAAAVFRHFRRAL